VSEYETIVFRSRDEAAAQELRTHIFTRYPPMRDDAPTCISACATGDAMSVQDAMRMALECREFDIYEQRELALEMAECVNWDDCIKKAEEWGMGVLHGDFVNATAHEISRSAVQANNLPASDK
jgi:hypothetical protein